LQIFGRYGGKCKQILIFSVFEIWSLSPYWLQIKFSMSLFFYLFTIVINLWHQKFVTEDDIAVFVNEQDDIQWRGQNFDKKFVFKEVHSKEVDRRISWKKAGQSMVLISCLKSCGIQAQLTQPPNATTQQPALFRTSHILPKKITMPLNA